MLVDAIAAVRRPCPRIGLLVILGFAASCFDPAPPVSNGDTDDGTTNDTTGATTNATTNGMTSITTNVSASVSTSDPTSESSMTTDSGDATAVETSIETTGGEAMCGDEVVEGAEECDDGPANADDAACTSTCTNAYCGDGLVLADVEECDDGDLDDDDACLGTCIDATCGDGFINVGTEACDGDDLGGGSCMDLGLEGDVACDEQCSLDTSNCFVPCPDGGARVSDMCWYLSAGCDNTDATCASHGLVGFGGYIDTAWDMVTMQAIADHYGWINGGVNNCCVEFGFVQDGTLYSHNYGAQFYNWDGCYDVYPTLKACDPP